MENERGHPKLSYEVWKINFHPQVAEENQFLPFKLFLPRISWAFRSAISGKQTMFTNHKASAMEADNNSQHTQ